MRQTIHPSPKPPIFCDRGLMVNQNLAGIPIGIRVDHTLAPGTIEVWQDGQCIGRIVNIGQPPHEAILDAAKHEPVNILPALRAQIAERDREIADLRASLQAAEAEVRAIKNSHAIVSDALEQAVKRENAAIQRAEKAEADKNERWAEWDRDDPMGEVGLENPDAMAEHLATLTPEDLAPIKELFERKKRERERIARLESDLAAARKALEEKDDGLRAVEDLIDNSDGVIGLHLNGDTAPWDELRTGGRFQEWLQLFDAALERINGEGHAD